MAKNRYSYSQQYRTDQGKRFYSTTLYPEILKTDADTYIIADRETRLDLLAYNYYNDSELYWVIAICNNIQGSIFVEPGTQLCIPNRNRLGEIISKLETLNK
ncbi:MAG: hypothetical protein JETCAE03_33160 [Ignavibacteriaceae bacterium]|jgi:hypothetical protein|nr:MAG: hypothetical protein JETCAE03_33160 [Ignavibacteriaceae bacterium]